MKAIEFKDLVVGLLTIIFLAMAFGQYGMLQRFAAKHAASSLQWGKTPPFFPAGFEKKERK